MNQNLKILVVNIGSSSIKFALYNYSDLTKICHGIAERIGLSNGIMSLTLKSKKQWDEKMPSHLVAIETILKHLEAEHVIVNKTEIQMVGFRTIIAGPTIKQTCIITPKVFDLMDKYAYYVPLHNPVISEGIKQFQKVLPHAQLTANFDTSFHHTIPRINYTYGLNKKLADQYEIRKYGFHGTSYEYITFKLEEILQKPKVNAIVMHMGNGVSVCAIKNSVSIDTSTGISSIGGCMMGTRNGDMDPGIIEILLAESKMSMSELASIMLRESGLYGVSQVSHDMRDVIQAAENGNEQAAFAIDLYAQKLADFVALYLNKVGPEVDAIVFTGGVGENASLVRKLVLEKITVKKLSYSSAQNESKYDDYLLISDAQSEVPVYAIRTNEELVIAKDAKKLYEAKLK